MQLVGLISEKRKKQLCTGSTLCPGGYPINPRNARVLKMQNFTPAYMSGVDVRADDFLRIKISWTHREPNFLTHGPPLPGFPSRESSAITTTMNHNV